MRDKPAHIASAETHSHAADRVCLRFLVLSLIG